MEGPQQEPQPERFDFTKALLQFAQKDASLRFNRVNSDAVLGETPVALHLHEKTWESGTKKNKNRVAVEMHIGLDRLPTEENGKFVWGTSSANDELLVKSAHELAHVYQNRRGLERALEDHLNCIPREMTSEQKAYVELYSILNALGSATGLSTLDIYAQQSMEANMNVSALEDMTELLGAYLISGEYFSWRLDHLRTQLSDMEKLGAASLIARICPI